jgi:hypothetical protein
MLSHLHSGGGSPAAAPNARTLALAGIALHRKVSALLKAALALSARLALVETSAGSKSAAAALAPGSSATASSVSGGGALGTNDAAAARTERLQLPAGVSVAPIALDELELLDASDGAAPLGTAVGGSDDCSSTEASEPPTATVSASAAAGSLPPAAVADAAGATTPADADASPPVDVTDDPASPRLDAQPLPRPALSAPSAEGSEQPTVDSTSLAAAPPSDLPSSSSAAAGERAAPPGSAGTSRSSAGLEEAFLGRIKASGAAKSHEVSDQLRGVLSTLEVEPTARHATGGAAGSGGPTEWASSAMGILTDLSQQVWPRWQRLLELASSQPGGLLEELSREYVEGTTHRFGESLFRESRLFEHCAYNARDGERGVPMALMATSLRSSRYYQQLPPPPLRNQSWTPAQQPVFFEQRYVSTAAPPPPATPHYQFSWSPKPMDLPPASIGGVHLIVFVHGFHGNSYDLRTMRDFLALLHPHKENLRYLCSSVNEEHTAHASFETLGANLAKEVTAFMRSENIVQSCTRLSFVCHSFGSLIARVALSRPDLAALHPLLHTYISFSGPHLGMLYGSNALVEIGMWGLRRWKGAQCLTELSLKDAKQPTETLLYRLSKTSVLGHFRNVLFVSSVEDRYVPHHSARVQLTDEAVHDHHFGPTFTSMVHNLLTPLAGVNVLHIEVRFGEPPAKKLLAKVDAAIGRTAHIGFLDNDPFIQMFVHTYLRYFV